MTEAEAREIVERYESLVDLAVRSHGQFEHPAFDVSYPIEVRAGRLVVTENIEGDPWHLRAIELVLE